MKEKANNSNELKELLLNYIKTGKERDFGLFYKKLYPNLYDYIFYTIKSDFETKDILSDVICYLYENVHLYDERYSPKTWIYKIAYSKMMGYFYKKNKTVSLNNLIESGIEIKNNENLKFNILNSEKEETEKYINTQKRFKMVNEQIENLPQIHKNYAIERFLNKKTYKEILNKMKEEEPGISMQTVKNRIHSSRKIIIRNLKNNKEFLEETEVFI